MEIIIDYSPRPLQLELHKNLKRWNVIVCHRRFGKTVFAINELIKQCMTCEHPNPRLAYLAPTYRQAKMIAWDYLKKFSRAIPDISINEAELRVDYPNGGRIQLFGCDNPDALRGLYLDGCVLDEYAQMPSTLFSEVLRPALSDRKGGAIFIGTPKGKNAFHDVYQHATENENWLSAVHRVSDTQLIDEIELADAQRIMTTEEYEQEYECSWSAAIKGAVYGAEMASAVRDKRIGFVPIEPSLEVHTFWDLGISDAMSIWFAQAVGREIRLIHYHEDSGKGMQHYANYLRQFAKDHGITYGTHLAPHDIEVRELMTGRSRRDTAADMGITFVVVRQHRVHEGIEAARKMLARCWFDSNRCKLGTEALQHYRFKWDDKRQTFADKPDHDWSSHCADAFRILAVGWNDNLAQPNRYENARTVVIKQDWSIF
jgi:phage terminase large subunit